MTKTRTVVLLSLLLASLTMTTNASSTAIEEAVRANSQFTTVAAQAKKMAPPRPTTKQTKILLPSPEAPATAEVAEITTEKSPNIATTNTDSIMRRLKIGSYFALWYALNIVYNVLNKKVLNQLPTPMTVGSMQFGVGSLYASLLWTLRLRARPAFVGESTDIQAIGIFHCIGQLFTMMSLGAASVSFTHLVKALEPFFSALVSALVLQKWMKPQVYASLIPVVAGVGYACLKERSFSWIAFSTAMGSNAAFALRAVRSKSYLSNSLQKNMTSANLFGLVTIMAFVFSIPIALALEGTSFLSLWSRATETVPAMQLMRGIFLSGLFHYLNNEVMYLALSNVHPVTLAVGNTMKRVFIMVASVIVFQTAVSLQAGVGAAIGILGVLLYSLTKQHYERLEALEKKTK